MRPILFVLLLTQINSPAANLSDLSYALINNESAIRILGCDKAASGDLEIPAEINGLPVTELNVGVFANCEALTNITVSASIATVPHNAFRSCSQLESVQFSEGVESIGVNAFLLCPSLASVSLPSTVQSVDVSSFSGASSLTSIAMDTSGVHYSTVNGVLYNADVTQIVRVPRGLTSFVMPDSVVSCHTSAFESNSNLTSITFGAGLSEVRAADFKGCTGVASYSVAVGHATLSAENGIIYSDTGKQLALFPAAYSGSFTIAEGVTSVGPGAFSSNSSQLVAVNFPNSLVEILDSAFKGSDKLSQLVFPAGLERVSDLAFQGCDGLRSIQFDGQSLELGQQCFSGCQLLDSIVLPDGLTSIPYACFSHCGSLTSFTLPSQLISIGDAAFSECKALKEVNFNENLLSIGDEAFFACESITSISLPEGVTAIADYAFSECTSLVFVAISQSVAQLGEWSFEGSADIDNFIVKGDAPIADLTMLGLSDSTTIYYSKSAQGYPSVKPQNHLEVDMTIYPAAWWLLERQYDFDVDLSMDLSGDGVSLLEAYAFGLNPNMNLSNATPIVRDDNGRLIYEYPVAASSVEYKLQASSDMASWLEVSPLDITLNSLGEMVYELNSELSARKFLRLQLLIAH